MYISTDRHHHNTTKTPKHITCRTSNTIFALSRTIHHRTNVYKTIIMPHSRTMIPTLLKTLPFKASLKTNVPEPSANAARNIISLMAAFSRLLYTIGNMPSYYTNRTHPRIKPVQCSQIKVPIELQSKLEEKIHEIINQCIITPETRPTE